jgi:hypothetical protein
MSDILLARSMLAGTAVVFFGIVAALVFAIDRNRPRTVLRHALGVALIIVLAAGIFGQLHLYTTVAHIRKPIDDDPFFVWFALGEMLMFNVLMFGVALRSRRRLQSRGRQTTP